MRRRRPTIVIGLVLAMLLSGVTACTGDDPKSSPTPSAENIGPTRGPTALDGGKVQVADSGYSLFYSTVLEGSAIGTFGAILENTSERHAAVGVTVIAKFLDETERVVGIGDFNGFLSSDAITILPGERKGLGSHVNAHPREDNQIPARMELEVRVASWWPASQVTGIAASDVRYERDASNADLFSFVVDSHLTQPLDDPRVIVILRDRQGKLLGGVVPERPKTPWPPGRTTQRVRMPSLNFIPKAVDTTRAEVYIGDAETNKQSA